MGLLTKKIYKQSRTRRTREVGEKGGGGERGKSVIKKEGGEGTVPG